MMELSDEDIQTWRCFIKKQFDNHEKVDALCDAALAHNAAKKQKPLATVRITEVFEDKQFPAGFSADDWQKLSVLKDGTKLYTAPPDLAEARKGGLMDSGHSCSYYCERPECIKAQRNELRDNADKQDAAIAALRTDLAYYQAKWEHELSTVSTLERELAACRDAISAAETIIALGVSLMPLEQLSQWTGVRAWQEFRKGR